MIPRRSFKESSVTQPTPKKENETDTTSNNSNNSSNGDKTKDDTAKEDPPKLLSALEEEEERRAITECLSCDGYQAEQISAEALERDLVEVQKIMELEIPVGDSASILRCGAPSMSSSTNPTNRPKIATAIAPPDGDGSTRDFQRVLTLYKEVLAEEKHTKNNPSKNSGRHPTPSKSRHASLSRTSPSSPTPHRPQGKPIIIVPNAMTSPITLVNAHSFFQEATFRTRQAG